MSEDLRVAPEAERVQEEIEEIQSEGSVIGVQSKGVGVVFCTLTLLGTRMGGGIVGIPFATLKVGFLTAILIQVVLLWVFISSVAFYLRIRTLTGRSSLSDIGLFCYGKFRILVIKLIAIAQLGFPIIFFIVFGDVAGGLIERVNTSGISFWSSRWFTHTLLAVVMLYLVIQKEIHQLKYAGFLLKCSITTFVILLFIHYMISEPDPARSVDLVHSDFGLKFFANLPTIISSYGIHSSFFTAFGALKDKTSRNGMKAGTLTLVILFVVYLCTPLISFKLFGHDVKSNMLKNVSEESGVIPIILLFLFMLIEVVHIPIIFFIGKEAVLVIFYELTKKCHLPVASVEIEVATVNGNVIPDEGEEHPATNQQNLEIELDDFEVQNNRETRNELNDNNQPSKIITETPTPNPKEYLNMKPVYYYSITLICYFIVVLLSIVVGDVRLFFGIIGSTVACFMGLTGPGSFYIITVHKLGLGFPDVKSVIFYIVAWIYMVVGITAMIGFNICVIANAIIG